MRKTAAGLEITAVGPTLAFDRASVICLVGADCGAVLDEQPVSRYVPLVISSGQTLRFATLQGPGIRAYLLFQGGLKVPPYLGSRATFTLGRFGGNAGRNLAAGDVLHLQTAVRAPAAAGLPVNLHPQLTHQWRLRVLSGPHGAPDFFTPADIHTVLEVAWKVHHNSKPNGGCG